MISVMKGFEIERKPAHSVTATADPSFLVMGNLQEGARFSDGGHSGVSSEPRVSSRVDLAVKMPDLETRVSGKSEQRGSGSLEEGAMLETDGGDDDIAYMDDEIRVSFVESSGRMHVFRIGDMVWGKVKSHPWWPGHIFNEAFASPPVRRMRRDGLVLVAFFGDSSYGWFDPVELIPFEPHFPEKSKQTTSRSFTKAVEEAVDEASRRGALAVACRCRNLHNFRPTNVTGYFFVDVVGYEPGGIYSSREIKKSRDSFVPVELLSFIQQLALGALRNIDDSIEWIQTIAKLLAYRKAVFEEFDETYAQAFGVDPVRPSPNSMVSFDQTDRYAPRGAPLSGPLVVAEALGERRSATKQTSNKPTNYGKKNKYELKRRDDLPAVSVTSTATATAASSSLPDLPSAPTLHHGFFPSLPDSTDPPDTRMDADYVLRKRENLPPPADAATALQSTTEETLPPGYPRKSEPVEVKNEVGLSESMVHSTPMECSQDYVDNEYQKTPLQVRDDGIAVVKKEKWPKRPRENLNEIGEAKKKRKKKKKDGLGADQFAAFLDADQRRFVAGRSIGLVKLLPQEDGINMELPLGLELSSLQLPQLVSDLSSIALDPFYAIERDAPAIVRHVFLRFRSLVYQKSLILPASVETAGLSQPLSADIVASVGREGREHRESSSSFKPPKPASRLGDSAKGLRKRDPSDRQEELSLKKMEKMNQLKQLATKKKKAAIIQKNPEFQQLKDPKDSTSSATSTATEASRKLERPPSPPSPTFLIMKFPPRSTLPSASNLKARFARFGPLDLLGTRVSWRHYICKVLFKHKSNAQSAFNFVQSNDLFGQVKVIYYLRDYEVSGPDQPLDPQNKPSDSSRSDKDSLQFHHVSSNIQKPSFSQAQHSQTQLKSILKKPGGDESGPNCAAVSSNVAKESQRVKFMLNGDEDRSSEPPPLPPPSKLVVSSNNGGGQAPLLSSADQISRQPPKSLGFFPPPLLQPLQPPYRGLEMHPSRIPPPSPSNLHQTLLPPPQMLPPRPLPPQTLPLLQPRGVYFPSSRGLLPPLAPFNEPREKMTFDISGPMLSLLLKCNDIVSNVKSSLGYNPYHSL